MEGAKHRDPDVPKEQEECDGCGYQTKLLRKGSRPFNTDTVFWFCEVCRSTFVANAAMYPNQYPEANAMRTIAWGINTILAAIEAKP